MKIKDAKVSRPKLPFYSDSNLTLLAHEEKNKIVKFEVRLIGKKPKFFAVKNNQILLAWKAVEKYVAPITVKLNAINL